MLPICLPRKENVAVFWPTHFLAVNKSTVVQQEEGHRLCCRAFRYMDISVMNLFVGWCFGTSLCSTYFLHSMQENKLEKFT